LVSKEGAFSVSLVAEGAKLLLVNKIAQGNLGLG